MLAGKKVVVVGGSSGIGLVHRGTGEARRRRRHHCFAQCRAARRGRGQAERRSRSRPMSPTTRASPICSSSCGPGRPCRASRRRSFAPARSRRSRWRTFAPPWKASSGAPGASRGGGDPHGRIDHAGVGLSQHPAAAEFGDHQRRQWRAGVVGARARAGAGAGARQLRLARDHRHADPGRDAGGGAQGHAGEDRGRLPVGRVGYGEDIARQILAFMTNGFATGSTVYLDGGALVV